MLGKPVGQGQDLARWRAVAAREAEASTRRLAQAEDRVREAEQALAEAQARVEVERACALAARAWCDRLAHVNHLGDQRPLKAASPAAASLPAAA